MLFVCVCRCIYKKCSYEYMIYIYLYIYIYIYSLVPSLNDAVEETEQTKFVLICICVICNVIIIQKKNCV
jgi:hypothetical protein